MMPKKQFLWMILVVSLFLIRTPNIYADDWSLEDALEWGINHNLTLQQIRTNVANIEEQISLYEAQLKWQLNIKSDLSYQKSTSVSSPAENQNLTLSLDSQRNFSWGMQITPSLFWTEAYSFFGEHLETDFGWQLQVSQLLYPHTITKEEQQYHVQLCKLKKEKLELEIESNVFKIKFAEDYLKSLRWVEELEILQIHTQSLQQDLERVVQQQELGEVGELQVLSVRIGLQEAELVLAEANDQFNLHHQQWYYDLGIPDGTHICLSEESSFIQSWVKEMAIWEYNQIKEGEFVKNHPKANELELEVELEVDRLKWNQEKDITAHSYLTHQKNSDYWSVNVGINVAYNILDGGKAKLITEGHISAIEEAKMNYQNGLHQLELQLSGLLSSLRLAEMNLETKKLTVEKMRLEVAYAKKGLDGGLITEGEYRKKMVELELGQLAFNKAQDQVFISKLSLAQFCGVF